MEVSTANRPVVQRTASLKNGNTLADMYGVTYDADALESKFNAATKAQYDASRREYMNTENAYYNNMYGNQQTALDTIRKNQNAAIATGASRGMQAANELSAILGMQQQGAQGATELTQSRNSLVDKEQAAYKQNAVDAQEQANSLGIQLGTLGSNIYASDTQYDVANLDYYAQLYTAEQNLAGMLAQAEANKYAADQNLTGTRYTADQNLAGNKYTADKNYAGNVYTADQNLAGNKYTADANLAGTKYNADQNLIGNKYVADQNLIGTKYTADQNLAGTKYNADQNLVGTKYTADQNLAGTKYNADKNYAGTVYAADQSAAATMAAAARSASAYSGSGGGSGNGYIDLETALDTMDPATFVGYMSSVGVDYDNAMELWNNRHPQTTATKSSGGSSSYSSSSSSSKSYTTPTVTPVPGVFTGASGYTIYGRGR